MLRKLSTFIVAAYVLFALCACDGRSGSSGVPYDGSSVDSGPTTTVRTKVALAYTLARGPTGEVVQMAATEADYRSASVKLTLPDGRILVMSYDGAGEYSCKVENLPAGSAGFIAAEFGGVVVKNFFDGLTAQGGAMDTGLTNPDSTLAADALAAFAQALAPVEGGYSVAELLSSVQNATLDIDVAALRTQIEDGQVAGYELARQSYNSILVWDNINLTTGQVSNLIQSDTEVDTLNELIANGGIRPPMRSNLAVEAKLVVAAFLDDYMNTRTVDAISPYLADTNFLNAGDDKPQFMLSALDEWSTSPKYLNLQSADLSGLSYAVTESADFTGAASAMYLVAVSGTYDLTYVGPQTVTRAWDGTSTGFYVGKVGGEWMIFGDRMRMWFDYSVGYFNTSTSGTFTELSFELGNSGTFTPASVTASNDEIFGASNPVEVTGDPLALTPRHHFTLEGAQDTTWSFYDIDSYLPTGISYVGIDSKIVTITATYAGASPVEESYSKVIRIKEPTTVITGFTQSPEGDIEVSWRPPLIDQQLLRVEVRLVGYGLNLTLPASDRSVTIPASALSNAGLNAGATASLDVVYFTPTSELGARQLFTYQGSTVIPRAAPPTFAPAPGVYLAPQAVAITSATPGAAIYYTTDGTSPTFSGLPYSGPVTVDQSMTLKAVAVSAGFQNSTVSTGVYELNVPPVLTIITRTLPDGLLGVAYSRPVVAAGGDAPYTWALDSGAPPTGLTLDTGTGLLFGTPTAAGTFTFTVRVFEQNTNSVIQAYTINITDAPVISTSTLPNGLVGTAYSQMLAASGGVAPYAWTVTSGALPGGLALDPETGAITGTPTTASTFNFTVRATGANTLYVEQPLSIVVTGPPAISTTTLPGGVMGTAYSQTVAATGGVTPYTWTVATGALPDGLTLDGASGAIAGTPTVASTFNFTVRATGANTLYAEQPLSIVITGPPTITTTTLPAGTITVAYSQTLAATGGVTPYAWSVTAGALPTGLTLDSVTGAITGTPTVSSTFNFTVRATGANTLFAEQPLSIVISDAPVISTTELPGGPIGTAYSQTVTATGGVTPYAWSVTTGALPDGLALDSVTGAITGTPTVANTFNFTVRATGANTLYDEQPLSIVVTGPPTVTTSSLPDGALTIAYSQTVAATGGVTPYTWSVTAGALPTGLTLDGSTGAISGTPSATGNFPFTIRATGADTLFDEQGLSIFITGAPTVTTTTLPNGALTIAYSQTVAATGGVTPYTWSVASGALPDGLNLNSSTGAITGTPTVANTFNFTVRATGANTLYGEQPLSIVVTGPPTVTTSSLPNGALTLAYSQTVAATGGVTPYTWSVTAGALPTGLTLDGSTGAITGTPTVANTFNFTVRATGANTLYDEGALTIVIAGAPTITTTTLPDGTVGTSYTQTVAATGGVTPYAWTLASGSLPAGLTLNAGTGEITGTPTTAGTANFTVQATDANTLFDEQALTITVGEAPTPPTITTEDPLPGGTVGSAYSQTLLASGGTAPLNWWIVTGTPPAGVSLTSGGVLSGTPSASGDYSFSVRVSDANSLTDQKTFSLTINAAPTAPVISTTTLPDGVFGQSYTNTISASGGSTPYTWTVSAGTPIDGVTLGSSTGQLSGVPSGAGTYNFTVRCTGANALFDEQAFTVTISGMPTIQTTSLPDGAVGTAYSQNLSAIGSTTPYTWTLDTGSLPDGLTLSTGGAITGTPTTAGAASFSVRCTGANGLSSTMSLTLTIIGQVTITTTSLPSGDLDDAYSQTLAVTGGVAPYAWSMLTGTLPTGVTLSGAGVLSGTPSIDGDFTFTTQVTDALSQTDTQTLTLTIFGAPTITTDSLANGQVNVAYSATVHATGGRTPYAWSLLASAVDKGTGETLVSTFPPGLAINPTTGVLSGTPTTPGTYEFWISCEGTNFWVEAWWATLNVIAGPSITNSSLPQAVLNGSYSQGLTVAGGTSPYTFTITSGALPNGLNLNNSNGLISGTATVLGDFNFTVRVTDNVGQFSSRSLSIAVDEPPVIGTVGLENGTVGVAYSQTLAASKGDLPYDWSISVGALPDGIALTNASGLISGTPPTAGTTNFTVRCTSANGLYAERQMSITVDPAGTELPKLSPPSGLNFGGAGGMTVTVTHTAPGAVLYVTTDGTDPSPANFNFNGIDSVEFSFYDTMTVKAMATVVGSPNSGVAAATYNAGVTVGPTETRFASSDNSGTQGTKASSSPDISGDGRFVAFASLADNLVGAIIGGGFGLDAAAPQAEIYVKDRQTGQTTIVSRNRFGAASNGDSSSPSISFDGRYVAFWSVASDLVADDTNGTTDVFVRDTQTGTLTRASVSPAGVEGNGGSSHPSISGDGRYVAFQSAASNLVTGDTNGQTDVFVRDMWTGAVTRVSIASDGTQGNGQSVYPAISHDGMVVAFATDASSLITTDGNGYTDIYVHDMKGHKTTRVSRRQDAPEANGDSNYPSVSADGTRVAFESRASNLVDGDYNGASDIFVAHMVWGTINIVSVGEGRGQSDGDSYSAEISADGNTVAFQSYAGNLVPSSTAGNCNIFVRDLFYLETGLTTLVTLGKDGMPADGGSFMPSISSDGRYVAYQSDATNLIVGDANGLTDIFATDTFRTFADPDIRAEIASQTGKTEPFSPLDLHSVTTINLGDSGGSNLMGVQYLPSLFEIDLSLNGVTDFTPLVACGKLTTLNLGSNQITSLAPLAHFPNLAGLTYLNLNSNLIEDLSPLTGVTYMPDLRVRSNKLTSIAPIRGIAFDNLDISLNCIADTSGLTATTLTDGQSGACPVAFADPILRAEVESILGVPSGTPLLYTNVAAITGNSGAAPVLNLSNLGITDLAGIEWLDGVPMMDLSGNPGVANLEALGGMNSLYDLKFGSSALTDLTPLTAAANLTRLSVPDNLIEDVSPAMNLPALANFDFSNNYVITAAPLLVHPALTTVNISDNCIVDTGEISMFQAKFGAGLTNTGQSGKCL